MSSADAREPRRPGGVGHAARLAGRRAIARAFGPLLRSAQEHRRSQIKAVGIPPKRIVLLGDSITEYGMWDEWFEGRPMLNRGIGGETSAQVLARLDTAIWEPLAVLLLIGTNDLSIGVPEDEIVANIRAILDGVERRAAGTPVILQSVMPRNARFRDEVVLLNRRLERLVADAPDHVRYLDLWPALADVGGSLKAAYSLDHLHLNGDGYRAWVQVLEPEIKAFARAA